MDEKPRRSRFRFGLRTLLELIAVVAVILGFILYRQAATRTTGRFQIQGTQSEFLVDTHSGRVWGRDPLTGVWTEEPGPGQ